MEMVKKDYTEGKIKPGSAAVINYRYNFICK
jgi:hypothetical protein